MEKRFPFLIGLIIILVLIGSRASLSSTRRKGAGDPARRSVDKVFGPGLHFQDSAHPNRRAFRRARIRYEARAAEALTSDKKL